MLNDGIRILKQQEDARFDTGTTIPIIRVVFMVGTFGPFTEKIDKAEFTQQTRDDRLNAFALHVAP